MVTAKPALMHFYTCAKYTYATQLMLSSKSSWQWALCHTEKTLILGCWHNLKKLFLQHQIYIQDYKLWIQSNSQYASDASQHCILKKDHFSQRKDAASVSDPLILLLAYIPGGIQVPLLKSFDGRLHKLSANLELITIINNVVNML